MSSSDSFAQLPPQWPETPQRRPRASIYGPAFDALNQIQEEDGNPNMNSSDANPSDSVKQIPQRPQIAQRRARMSIYGPASDALNQIQEEYENPNMNSSDANPSDSVKQIPQRPQIAQRRGRMSIIGPASDALNQIDQLYKRPKSTLSPSSDALDQKQPKHSEGDKSQRRPTHIPETNSSCCNRMFFWWVTPLLVLSGKRSIASPDLWKTPPYNRAGRVTAEVERLYTECKVILNGCP